MARRSGGVLDGWGGFGVLLLLLAAALPSPALAINLFVEDWSGTWDSGASFFDDFADGVLSPSIVSIVCGANALGAGDEAGGALRLRPSDPECGGTRILTQFAAASVGGGAFQATYRYRQPEALGQGYGISIGNPSQQVTLGIFGFLNPINQDEQVIALLFDETFDFASNFLEFLVLPDENFAFERVNLEITLTEVAGMLVPHGRLAFDGGPLQDLGENVSPTRPGDLGALPAGVAHFANLFRTGVATPEPGISLLLLGALPWIAGRGLRRGRGTDA